MHFLTTLFQPVVYLFIAACSLRGGVIPGFLNRAEGGFWWGLVFLGIAILALIGLIVFYVV